MVLQSTRWLALSYFTYFFSYGIFLPFWGVWLKGEGIAPETIGMLLGAGLVARFLGSLLIAPRVKILSFSLRPAPAGAADQPSRSAFASATAGAG